MGNLSSAIVRFILAAITLLVAAFLWTVAAYDLFDSWINRLRSQGAMGNSLANLILSPGLRAFLFFVAAILIIWGIRENLKLRRLIDPNKLAELEGRQWYETAKYDLEDDRLESATKNLSEASFNIVSIGADIALAVELDRREVFRRSQHDLALQAITAKFINQSQPGGTGIAKQIGARVLVYEASRAQQALLEIDHVCWLDHEEPFIDFPRDAPQRIVLGVFEPKPTSGFEPRVTFYENHTDRHVPLDRYEYAKPYEHLYIKVILNGAEYWYELNIQYGTSYSFESFTERDTRLDIKAAPKLLSHREQSKSQEISEWRSMAAEARQELDSSGSSLWDILERKPHFAKLKRLLSAHSLQVLRYGRDVRTADEIFKELNDEITRIEET